MIFGADISSGNHDFRAFRAAGGEFVIISLGDGLGERHANLRAGEFATGAREAGLRVGFYHFNRARRLLQGNVRAEAEWMRELVDRAGGLHPGDLRIAMDIERTIGEDAEPDQTRFMRELRVELQRLFGHDPFLYSGWSWVKERMWDAPGEMDLWVAWWPGVGSPQEAEARWPETRPGPAGWTVHMWQYGGDITGGVPGLSSCDVNITPDLGRFLIPEPIAEPIPPDPVVVTPPPAGQVVLSPRCSRLTVDVEDDFQGVGARILQTTLRASASASGGGGGGEVARNQRWLIEEVGGGDVRLRSVSSGMVVDVAGWSMDDGATLHMWEWHGGANQRWRMTHKPDGWMVFVNVHSGKAIDIPHGLADVGVRLQQWSPNGAAAQDFSAVATAGTDAAPLRIQPPADPPPPPPPPPAGMNADEAAGHIANMNFFDGVSGFQEALGIAVDGDIGPETIGAVERFLAARLMLERNFHLDEFRCSHCGRARANPALPPALQRVRDRFGPLDKFSSYRCPDHPLSVSNPNSMHKWGAAWDPNPYLPPDITEGCGWSGFGISAVADPGKVSHLDVIHATDNNFRNATPEDPSFFTDN